MPRRYLIALLLLSSAALLVASAALIVATRASRSAERSARAVAMEADLRSIQDFTLRQRASEAAASATSLPSGTLTVHDDGCGVVRSEFGRDPQGLGWSIRDQDGFEVLQRNAKGQTRYRYFQGGTYTVVLVAWGGDTYEPISNEVTIHC